ncbi:hypothetical protein [Clostridium fungisolvens]|uniref:DUF4345 domain-containing protein n=1 Tax=Clostridium fungisolvens TaxID=1604897 RepID=A0A6V8SM68_9CLOT|nr:hypothetical protein [Clostridium fungisolvens]GFP76268.1 hypothetical protein bsdtw1_02369 [Clostridium fungisolvens]
MKINKILFYVLTFAMLVGGIMGIVKGLVPKMTWFSFRHLLGMGGTFNGDNIPNYAVVYGILMAMLEIVSSILLLTKKRIAIKFSIITMSINALGCVIAILLGDILAIGSLLIRFFAIYILIKAQEFISLNKENS